jgi:hypothetical protein
MSKPPAKKAAEVPDTIKKMSTRSGVFLIVMSIGTISSLMLNQRQRFYSIFVFAAVPLTILGIAHLRKRVIARRPNKQPHAASTTGEEK